jgi:MFS family permease
MSAKRNLQLITPYLALSLEGVCHGIYLLWLTVHKGIPPFAAAMAIAAGDVALMVLEVPTGVFADRLGARRSLLLGSACQVLGLALFWKTGTLPMLVPAVLAIALGDAFRHGADEALVYRSCAALGEAHAFGRRFARAQAWALAAMVGLTAAGGWIAAHVGFDAAWAIEVALAIGGFGLACAMTDLPAAPDEPEVRDDEDEGTLAGGFVRAIGARVPWAILAPATIVVALGSIVEMLAQTSQRDDRHTALIALTISGALALEALGAALVARGLIPLTAWVLDAVVLASLAGLALVAITPAALLPAVLLIFLGTGAAPAIRSALVQQRARDGERATVASAASAADMLGKTAGLPLAAWLTDRFRLPGTAAILGFAAIVLWAVATRRKVRVGEAR